MYRVLGTFVTAWHDTVYLLHCAFHAFARQFLQSSVLLGGAFDAEASLLSLNELPRMAEAIDVLTETRESLSDGLYILRADLVQ